jgi:hypothetical protein
MAHQSIINAFRNINQLSCLSNCKIISSKRGNISAELVIRDGKYKLRIDIKVGEFPKVYVVEPEIDRSNPLEIHTFGFKYHPYYKKELPLLCLTHLGEDKTNTSMLLTETYIPWAIEWTEFYELWLLTGKWYGKGIHPDGGNKNENQ